MFYTVPTQKEDFSFNTPLGAKSLVGYFFELKRVDSTITLSTDDVANFSVFQKQLRYIDVGGRIIFKDMILAPFMTDLPMSVGLNKLRITIPINTGTYRYKIQDVFIPAKINVDNTEIKISGFENDLFNIVFIFSDKKVDKEWYLFFEYFKKDPYLKKNKFALSYSPDLFFFFGTTLQSINPKNEGLFVPQIKEYMGATLNLKGNEYWLDEHINASLATITSHNSWKKVKILSQKGDSGKNIEIEFDKLPPRSSSPLNLSTAFWKNITNYFFFFGSKKSS